MYIHDGAHRGHKKTSDTRTRVTDSCKHPSEHWESSPGQPMLLTAKSFRCVSPDETVALNDDKSIYKCSIQ